MPKSKYELIYKDLNVRTKVITFTELIVDEKLSQKTDFPVGTEVYFIQRVRYLDDIAKMVDTNLLRKDIIKDLTKEIAQESGRCLRCDHFGFGIFKGGREKLW